MLDKPLLDESEIVACASQHYGITVTSLEFLPIGNNPNTWVYRVVSPNTRRYFMKLNRAPMNPRAILIPQYLHAHGIPEVVAPLTTHSGVLAPTLEDYHIVLYPYVQGQNAWSVDISDAQWWGYGKILRSIHSIPLPPHLAEMLPRETYEARWHSRKRTILDFLSRGYFETASQSELAAFWKEKSHMIEKLEAHTIALGTSAAAEGTAYVLCHADIHRGNVLIGPGGELYFVDWDQSVLAPRECDLLFVLDSWFGSTPQQESEFFDGYGAIELNRTILVYYQSERTMTDLIEFAAQVFVDRDMGEATQQEAVVWFKSFFTTGRAVDKILEGAK